MMEMASLPYKWVQAAFMEGIYSVPKQRAHFESIRTSPRHDYLYQCLSILDAKAAALLQYDAIVLAAATLTLGIIGRNGSFGSYLIAASLIISGVSSIACLQIVWVHWALTEDLGDPSVQFLRLMKVRNRRTLFCRLAWILAQLSGITLIVGIISAKI
jgi:hypothetical protein